MSKPKRSAHPAVQRLQLRQLDITPNFDIANEGGAWVLGNACELVLYILQLTDGACGSAAVSVGAAAAAS